MGAVNKIPREHILAQSKYSENPNPMVDISERFFDQGDIDRVLEATGTTSWEDLAKTCNADPDDPVEVLMRARTKFHDAVGVIDDELIENFTPIKDGWAGRLLTLMDISRLFISCLDDDVYFIMEDIELSDVPEITDIVTDDKPTVFIVNRDFTGGSGVHWYAISVAKENGKYVVAKMCSEGIPFEDGSYQGSDGNTYHSSMRTVWNEVARIIDADIIDLNKDIQTDKSNCGIFTVLYAFLLLKKELDTTDAIKVMSRTTSKIAEFLRNLLYMETQPMISTE